MNLRNNSVFIFLRSTIGLMMVLQLSLFFSLVVPHAYAQTAQGVIEQRPAPVALRKCIGGIDLCNEDTDCPGSTCFDRNVFNLSVAVHFDASDADITTIKDMISDGSAVLFDATDGQAEIGQATIHNNVFGTKSADVRIFDRTCWDGTSTNNICTTDNDCPPNPPDPPPHGICESRGFSAGAGHWKDGSSIFTSIGGILARARPGDSFAHEFTHLVFDARDEYEARPGCLNLAVPPDDDCPIPSTVAAGEPPSLMDSGFDSTGAVRPRDEYCWGQGDSSDATDISGGNHDADNTTEQSQCRSNRSVWDQVVWSWPNVFQVPTAGPDPAANGAVANPTQFIVTNETQRVVLVLDESGSMSKEAPSRMERLKVAAEDFVTLAEDGTELGLVSYSDDAADSSERSNVDINALGEDRSVWTDEIYRLTPDNWTNIGAGLQKAREMITTAGGVTGNTYIVLMTDGLNNKPEPQTTADADLQAKISDLLADGIPVYVTCTGSDRGLDSQCAEIATGTGGHYVDSDSATRLPEVFVDFHERIAGGEPIMSASGQLSKAKKESVFVEQGSESVAFTLIWDNANASAGMTIIDPNNKSYDSLAMRQGRYFRKSKPVSGEWRVKIEVGGDVFVDSDYVMRAFSKNRSVSLAASVSKNNVRQGEAIRIHAFPKSLGGSAITHPTEKIVAEVIRPDGSIGSLELHDQGRDKTGTGDDVPQDGIFTGFYKDTQMKGAYTFIVRIEAKGWVQSLDDLMDSAVPGKTPQIFESPRFVREFRISAVVADPRDVETHPEDGPGTPPAWWEDFGNLLLLFLLLGLILALLVFWYCCFRPKPIRKLANLMPVPDPRPGIGFCRLVEAGPEKGKLLVTVRNYGDANAPASTTTVTFATGESEDLPTPPIRAGESVDLDPVDFPRGCFSPNCHFRIVADSKNVVTESDKVNNVVDSFCLG
jgi:hypothetical protein